MAARQSRRVAGKPPEDQDTSKITKALEGVNRKRQVRDDVPLKIGPPVGVAKQKEKPIVGELPYMEVQPLPIVTRVPTRIRVDQPKAEEPVPQEPGFKNKAPLQVDEAAKKLLQDLLRNPISISAERLLNVSEPMRQELKKMLTKKRLENKTVTLAADVEVIESEDLMADPEPLEVNTISIDKLPSASFEITTEDMDGVPKGSIVISDPVVQYLSTLQPGEKPKSIIVARESQSLRAVYPLINHVGKVESLLDGGSQIVSMLRAVAVELEITWDPDITVQMQSANRTLEQTLGLAKNVPFLFGHITVYLQVHVIDKPAYKVLLGRPFDTLTESEVKNARDGGQSLTLTDPNTGERCVMHTNECRKIPTVMKKPIKRDFQLNSMI